MRTCFKASCEDGVAGAKALRAPVIWMTRVVASFGRDVKSTDENCLDAAAGDYRPQQ